MRDAGQGDKLGDKLANGVVIAVCAQFALGVSADNLPVWRDVLAKVLPHAGGCEDMAPLIAAAWDLVEAEGSDDFTRALSRLRWRVEWYFQGAAAKRFEAWRAGRRMGRR